jgi:hypothetical protein
MVVVQVAGVVAALFYPEVQAVLQVLHIFLQVRERLAKATPLVQV